MGGAIIRISICDSYDIKAACSVWLLRSVECCGILCTGYNTKIQKEVNSIIATVHKVDCTMKIP